MAKDRKNIQALITQFENQISTAAQAQSKDALRFKFQPISAEQVKMVHQRESWMKDVMENAYHQLFTYNQEFESLIKEQRRLLEAHLDSSQINDGKKLIYQEKLKKIQQVESYIETRKEKMIKQLQAWPEIVEILATQNKQLSLDDLDLDTSVKKSTLKAI